MKEKIGFQVPEEVKIPKYKAEDVLKAIKEEGLISGAWGYKTYNCIWVYTDAMEDDEIWTKFPTPLHGFEVALFNSNCVDSATYFLLEEYHGNYDRLSWEANNPDDKVKRLIPDDL